MSLDGELVGVSVSAVLLTSLWRGVWRHMTPTILRAGGARKPPHTHSPCGWAAAIVRAACGTSRQTRARTQVTLTLVTTKVAVTPMHRTALHSGLLSQCDACLGASASTLAGSKPARSVGSSANRYQTAVLVTRVVVKPAPLSSSPWASSIVCLRKPTTRSSESTYAPDIRSHG